jgi:hypothetical protein
MEGAQNVLSCEISYAVHIQTFINTQFAKCNHDDDDAPIDALDGCLSARNPT